MPTETPILNKKLNPIFALNILLSAICLLTACGTKGPLYIPEQRYPQGVEQPAKSNNPDSNKGKTPVIPPVEAPATVKDY